MSKSEEPSSTLGGMSNALSRPSNEVGVMELTDGQKPMFVSSDQPPMPDQKPDDEPKKGLGKCMKKGKSKEKKLSPDFIIILSTYSAICGIMSVYTSVAPVVYSGPLPSFLCVTIVGLLFTYSIVLIVMGLRPNDPTMLDEIIAETIPKAKIPLRVIGQFTSGFMMIVFQFLGFELQAQTMEMAFFKVKTDKSYHICCIIFLFIMIVFIHIFNPAIFVPLTSLPTVATIFGFIVTIYWVSKNTTAAELKGYAQGWSRKWGMWAVSNKKGGGAFLELVGVMASVFYLHSIIQQILINAKHPSHNVRNAFIAFLIAIMTMLFTNFVAALPFGEYNGGINKDARAPATNLVLNMGFSPLIRANNIILFLFSIPIAPLQWAVIRQNTVSIINWEKTKCPKAKWPVIVLYQLIIVAVSFVIAWVQPDLQILLQVATFPAAIYWVCFIPAFHHILTLATNPEKRKKWYFVPWCIWDTLNASILAFCEIVQFIPQL